ncbi:MAG: cupin domain-containing protein [Acutalibacteraceae bacterium]
MHNQNNGCRCGNEPLVVNIQRAVCENSNYRTTLWTGDHLQLTLMTIPVGGDIGVEVHEDTDQFICIEQGCATVRMGNSKCSVQDAGNVRAGFAIAVPAGTWHNIVNRGNIPLRLYSLYAPPHHAPGTVHRTKADAQREK